jgi:hypothetical protein
LAPVDAYSLVLRITAPKLPPRRKSPDPEIGAFI